MFTALRQNKGDALQPLTSPGNLLTVCASHVVVPIHKGAQRIIAPCPHVQLKEGRGNVVTIRDADELEEVEAGTFRPLDAHYLEVCFLLRDAAREASGGSALTGPIRSSIA